MRKWICHGSGSKDLKANRGASLVVAGEGSPLWVHDLAAAIINRTRQRRQQTG